MKFVCFDEDAVEEMVAGRYLQSVDFTDGKNLIDRLNNKTQLFKGIGRSIITLNSDGMYFTTPGKWKAKRYLVIDCDTSGIFKDLSSRDALTTLQKILRFSLKFWSGSAVFNGAEKMVAGTSKSIIFPLPSSSGGGFRVAIERDPWNDRLTRRDMGGKFLLAYKSGFEKADSATEEADLKNFKKAFESLEDIYRNIDKKVELITKKDKAEERSEILEDFHLSGSEINLNWNSINGFKDLALQQKTFIQMPPEKAVRLVGGAGTGKTTTLILRTLLILTAAEMHNTAIEKEGEERDPIAMKALFVTHSVATRQAIENEIRLIDKHDFLSRDHKKSLVSLTVSTLADVCADKLSQVVAETEFVDRDAHDSKILQGIYIEEAIKEARVQDYPAHKSFLSSNFKKFFDESSDKDLAPLFQHEISVQIKGRSGDSFDRYKECKPLTYGVPTENDADKGFSFAIFKYYQARLEKTYQFDNDDVVITAINQLDTPIWRRRRAQEGYDFIAIDETHLFNINELHIFHYLTRNPSSFPISFAVDQAQAIGERGWDVSEAVDPSGNIDPEIIKYSTVFRSSPQITEFCSAILASGATLFTKFFNSLEESSSNFAIDEQRKSQPIHYISCADDDDLIERSFTRAATLAALTGSKPWEVLIVCLTEDTFDKLRHYADLKHKPVTVLDRRGDVQSVKGASKSGHMILALADYVGGLEFNVVVVVGVDKGRVPDEGSGAVHTDARNYMKYTAHNRLYVACSRAKYALEILGVKARGPSEIITGAFDKNLIEHFK